MVSPVFHKFEVPEEMEEKTTNSDHAYRNDGSNSSSTDDDEEFEFAILPQGQDIGDLDDSFFTNARAHPVYPVFNRSLLLDGEGGDVDLPSSFQKLSVEETEEERSASPKGSDCLESAPANSYCVWSPDVDPAPPLDPSKKSRSTGTSSSRKWKLMDFMVGRSRSDGKEKFLFLAPPTATAATQAATAERKKTVVKKVAKEMDMKTAHKLYYGKGGAVSDRKQSSYLPYRRRLVGFNPF